MQWVVVVAHVMFFPFPFLLLICVHTDYRLSPITINTFSRSYYYYYYCCIVKVDDDDDDGFVERAQGSLTVNSLPNF